MLRRLTKCEFRYWATAPWFYSVVFGVAFAYVSYKDAHAYSDFKVTLMVMLPMIIFIGGLIMVMGWVLERGFGGTRTAMTMPVSRREFLKSKFTAVFGGQIFFLIVLLLALTIPLIALRHGIQHRYYAWTTIFFMQLRNGVLITTALTILASGLNFILALNRRIITAIAASALLVALYHVLFEYAGEGESRMSFIPFAALWITALALAILVPFFSWKFAWRHFSEAKDIN